MSSARSKPLGLRTRLTLWTSLVLAASLVAGFAWVHHGLGRVLEGRNDDFLQRKAAELLAAVDEDGLGDTSELEEEIRREVSAYEADGLIVVVRMPGRAIIAPQTDTARRVADQDLPSGVPRTVGLPGVGDQFRVLLTRSGTGPLSMVLAISLAETEATLAQFDRRVAGGAVAFLILAVAGGLFLSRQALRPVAESVRSARRLDAEKLSERLPRTGAGDELDELAATINGLLDRLAAYHAQVIRFTADASHELRSPLAAMRAAVEVALHRPREPDEYRDVLALLGEQCERLTALVNALLLLARADAGEVLLAREAVDLAAMAREVAEMFEPLAEEKGVRLIADCHEPTRIVGDPPRLRQLVTNLLDNAIRFTEPGGSVALAVDRAGDRAILRVTDTGIGISAIHLPHVCERFYQVDSARGSGGCGLGLSICRWIVEAHGGSLEAESREGRGSVFTASVPMNPRPSPEPSHGSQAPRQRSE
ncbi:MAG: ATP-binding protein [Isosphaeraceae bacterium]